MLELKAPKAPSPMYYRIDFLLTVVNPTIHPVIHPPLLAAHTDIRLIK